MFRQKKTQAVPDAESQFIYSTSEQSFWDIFPLGK